MSGIIVTASIERGYNAIIHILQQGKNIYISRTGKYLTYTERIKKIIYPVHHKMTDLTEHNCTV
jgi:hypothetical protein